MGLSTEFEIDFLLNGLNTNAISNAGLPLEYKYVRLTDMRSRIQSMPSGSRCEECNSTRHATRKCPSLAKVTTRGFASCGNKNGSWRQQQADFTLFAELNGPNLGR